MSQVRITHISGPTVLIELDGWRLRTAGGPDVGPQWLPIGVSVDV